MYNYQSDLWLFEALQGYYTEELTEEALIKRQHAAEKSKAQEPLLKRLGNSLVVLRLKLKTNAQPEADTPMYQGCEPSALECRSLFDGGTSQ